MATLKPALSEDEVKKLGVAQTRTEYNKLAINYNKIVNNELLLCPVCNTWQSAKEGFYTDKTNATGRFYECKRCLLKEVEQRRSDKDEPNETKESVQKVLRKMNRVYDDSFYNDCVKGATDGVNEKMRHSAWATYITAVSSLPQFKDKTWDDSDFGSDNSSKSDEEIKVVQKTIKEGKRIFGSSYNNEDLMFLMSQYDDWRTRTQVDSKSQETYVMQICLQLLDIDKDRRAGKDVTNKLKALDTLMNGANLQPKQNVGNSATDSLTFGQLIEKWEMERPIPEPSEEFKDVDEIGKYIRVWFAGHIMKALNIKNPYSQEYEEEINKYKVKKASSEELDTSKSMYEEIFGTID